jgi:nitrite reductase (NO-forming)
MRRRHIGTVYQLLARIWLTGAGFAFVLPEARRLGLWLPLHMALAGAASTAISGAMQGFAAALTAAPDPPRALPVAQLASVTAGAALIAFGYPTRHPGVVVAGGVLFGVAMLLLAVIVGRMWRRSINKRHPVPMLAYAGALAAAAAGVTLGALIGSGAVGGGTWIALRQAHMVTNVLGFVTLTIVGTILTLLPTLLRVRIPAWHPLPVIACLVAAVASLGLGTAVGSRALAGIGAFLLAVSAVGIVGLAVAALEIPRRHHVPIAAKHVIAGVGWFAGGSVALAASMASSVHRTPGETFVSFRGTFLVAFVAGWILQVLVGSWLYLLPAQRPSSPHDRKRLLAGVELGGTIQLLTLNGGLVLVAADLGSAVTRIGGITAGFGALIALTKAWAFPRIAALGAAERRAASLWSPDPAA